MDEKTEITEGPLPVDPSETEILSDELIEDVSIDGMCGVY